MSTDSSELTFVRCPSCRSLVPAVSTRCRMCGASLEASAKRGEEEAPQRPVSRVRQRTASTDSSDEFAATRDRVRIEPDELEVEPKAAKSLGSAIAVEPEEQAPLDDPLSAYVEEVEVPLENTPARAKTEEPPQSYTPKAVTPEPEPELGVEEDAAPDFSGAVSGNGKIQPDAPEAKSEEHPEPRVRVESGLRRKGKKPGLFLRRNAQQQHDDEVDEAPEVESAEPAVVEPVKPVPSREERHVPPKYEERRATPIPEPVRPVIREEVAEPEIAVEQELEEEPPAQSKPAFTAKVEEPDRREIPARKPQQEKAKAGRLFGWLVSYSQGEGDAIELREGKFFVTANSLKESDLIIKDPSVSTPHAMISVSTERGLQIQDLLSERGVFIRRQGLETYKREETTLTVKNGDWIRFGDVEFLVALVPHVGAK